ncbi:MAG: helix-turn-helix domain-containing protein [Parabacteroides sp.]
MMMNTQLLPQLDLPMDFIAGSDVTENILKFYNQTCRLKAAIFVLCMEGEFTASVNLTEYKIRKNDFITLMPGSLIRFCPDQTMNVRLSFIGFSSKFMSTVNLIQATMNLLPVMMEYPMVHVDDEVAQLIVDYHSLISRVQMRIGDMAPESITQMLLSVIYGVSNLYRRKEWPAQSKSRSEEIRKKFIQLAMENYTQQRNTSFYASRLSISSQHLCMIIKQKTGKSVSDIIAEMVIMDAKSQLKSTDLTIQEISYSLNFPNVSFFGKYFKRYVGLSPQNYRNS